MDTRDMSLVFNEVLRLIHERHICEKYAEEHPDEDGTALLTDLHIWSSMKDELVEIGVRNGMPRKVTPPAVSANLLYFPNPHTVPPGATTTPCFHGPFFWPMRRPHP